MSDQFWVIAADGNEYGPAGAARLRQWVRENRIIATTRIRREGSEPVEARALPELAGAFHAPAGAAGSAAGGSHAGAPDPGAPAVATGAADTEFRVWRFISQAWDLVRPHWFVLGAMFFILTAIWSAPYVGWIAGFIVSGAIMVGIWRTILGLLAGRRPEIGMMFEGFDRLLDAFLATLVMTVLIVLGYVFLIVPGIILTILWSFAYAVLAERPIDFWEAMRASADLTRGYRWRLFLLMLAAVLILWLGLLVLFVGVFIAQAVVLTAFALAYRHLQERAAARRLAPSGAPAPGGAPGPGAPGPAAPGPGAPADPAIQGA
jgi:uncharacterized membrane protein